MYNKIKHRFTQTNYSSAVTVLR